LALQSVDFREEHGDVIGLDCLCKDVDVFLRFKNLSVRHDPARIYEEVKRVLVEHYGLKDHDPDGRVTEQAPSGEVRHRLEVSCTSSEGLAGRDPRRAVWIGRP